LRNAQEQTCPKRVESPVDGILNNDGLTYLMEKPPAGCLEEGHRKGDRWQTNGIGWGYVLNQYSLCVALFLIISGFLATLRLNAKSKNRTTSIMPKNCSRHSQIIRHHIFNWLIIWNWYDDNSVRISGK